MDGSASRRAAAGRGLALAEDRAAAELLLPAIMDKLVAISTYDLPEIKRNRFFDLVRSLDEHIHNLVERTGE